MIVMKMSQKEKEKKFLEFEKRKWKVYSELASLYHHKEDLSEYEWNGTVSWFIEEVEKIVIVHPTFLQKLKLGIKQSIHKLNDKWSDIYGRK